MSKKVKKQTKKQAKAKSVGSVIGHRAGSKRARAHEIIAKAGGMKSDPAKTILAIRKLKVKPATATSWYYDMRRFKGREQRPSATR